MRSFWTNKIMNIIFQLFVDYNKQSALKGLWSCCILPTSCSQIGIDKDEQEFSWKSKNKQIDLGSMKFMEQTLHFLKTFLLHQNS